MTGSGGNEAENAPPGFYGHEIKGILTLGDEILRKLDQNAGILTVENLTDTTMSIFRNVLVNPTPWEDLDEVRKPADFYLPAHYLKL